MKGPKSETDFVHFDPFTLTEYENLVRTIRIHALKNPGLLDARGESFVTREDIVIDDLISMNGVFTVPYEIKRSSVSLCIKKGSFYLGGGDISSRITTESVCEFLLQREEGGELSDFPEILKCKLSSHNTYVERAEATLLSKKKVFIEKTYNHVLTTTELDYEVDPELISDTAQKTYKTEGFCKVDATTGYVMEEK